MAFTKEQILGAERKADAIEMIKANISGEPWWAIRGMLAIFAKQTADEQSGEHTRYDNKVGFNATDAEILSSFAKQVQKWEALPAERRPYNMPLSPKQLGLMQRKMVKYAKQLLQIAQAKAAAVAG